MRLGTTAITKLYPKGIDEWLVKGFLQERAEVTIALIGLSPRESLLLWGLDSLYVRRLKNNCYSKVHSKEG